MMMMMMPKGVRKTAEQRDEVEEYDRYTNSSARIISKEYMKQHIRVIFEEVILH